MKEAYRHLTAAAEAKETAIGRLAEIIAILRVECPWDRVQTHESLRAGMLEEAYEVVEAIDNKEMCIRDRVSSACAAESWISRRRMAKPLIASSFLARR